MLVNVKCPLELEVRRNVALNFLARSGLGISRSESASKVPIP